jgi:hypothetical protein
MSRSTDRHASVPLFTNRTISTLGTRSITACAIVFCRRAGTRLSDRLSTGNILALYA